MLSIHRIMGIPVHSQQLYLGHLENNIPRNQRLDNQQRKNLSSISFLDGEIIILEVSPINNLNYYCH